MDVLFLIGRIIFGGYFIYNGINHFQHHAMMSGYAGSKGVPSPKVGVAVSGVLLLIGGITILLGFYPRVGIICLLIFFIPVSIKMHDYWNVENQQEKMNQRVNFLKNLALVGALLMFFAIEVPWPLSVG